MEQTIVALVLFMGMVTMWVRLPGSADMAPAMEEPEVVRGSSMQQQLT
jgi:hypothetical protein